MEAFSILVVSDRPAVLGFFRDLRHRTGDPVSVCTLSLASNQSCVVQHVAAAVVVVDAALDPPAAIALCGDLHAQQAGLPLVGLLCCPAALTPWHVDALLASGVRGLLDLRATDEEMLYLLQRVVRGEFVFHAQLSGERVPDLVHGALATKSYRHISGPPSLFETAHARLLALVARGVSDAEIGARLCLSPYTIKHQIERLRDAVGVDNRVELAAWAGRHGFYHPDRHVTEEAQLDHVPGRNRPSERGDTGLPPQ